MAQQCPVCNSSNIETLDYGKKTGATVGFVGGAASGAAGALGGARVGAAVGMFAGPVGIGVGSVVGAVLGGLLGGTAGGVAGAKIGHVIDEPLPQLRLHLWQRGFGHPDRLVPLFLRRNPDRTVTRLSCIYYLEKSSWHMKFKPWPSSMKHRGMAWAIN